ncbi:GNAT family N-acetyltransferase [Macrococcus animalis]|uniref:GNAT family N-acetyltransferase n=1 Tax=Macrococcus animalis TaxID=3395467 RepID=UPI0039BDEC66
MSQYQIKQLNLDEFELCENIWSKKENPEMIQTFYNQIASGNRLTFIYTENDEFIGEGSLVFSHHDGDYTIPNQRVYLSRMIVKEDYRNRGIGGEILDYLIDYAKDLGYEEISLGVDTDNLNARHLYEKKGFTEVLFEGEDEYGEYVKLLKRLN